MGTITGLTASRMLEIEAESIVDGNIVGDDLVLVRHDGVEINAGNVRGIQGLVGPAGSAGSTSRIDIQMSAANAIEIHLGATGLADALNITPTGPTGVRFVSGADYVGGVSTARADEAVQFEIFDHGFNFYVDLSTTAGVAYTPTKRVTINSTGILVYLAGAEKVRLDASNARAAFTGDSNGLLGYDSAGASKYLIGLRPDISGNSDDLVSYLYAGKWGWYSGPKRMELTNDGKLSVFGGFIEATNGHLRSVGVGGTPRVYLKATDAALDTKIFDIMPGANTLIFRSVNDAENAASTLVTMYPNSGTSETHVAVLANGLGLRRLKFGSSGTGPGGVGRAVYVDN